MQIDENCCEHEMVADNGNRCDVTNAANSIKSN